MSISIESITSTVDMILRPIAACYLSVEVSNLAGLADGEQAHVFVGGERVFSADSVDAIRNKVADLVIAGAHYPWTDREFGYTYELCDEHGSFCRDMDRPWERCPSCDVEAGDDEEAGASLVSSHSPVGRGELGSLGDAFGAAVIS